jgi:hypothetical protein
LPMPFEQPGRQAPVREQVQGWAKEGRQDVS